MNKKFLSIQLILFTMTTISLNARADDSTTEIKVGGEYIANQDLTGNHLRQGGTASATVESKNENGYAGLSGSLGMVGNSQPVGGGRIEGAQLFPSYSDYLSKLKDKTAFGMQGGLNGNVTNQYGEFGVNAGLHIRLKDGHGDIAILGNIGGHDTHGDTAGMFVAPGGEFRVRLNLPAGIRIGAEGVIKALLGNAEDPKTVDTSSPVLKTSTLVTPGEETASGRFIAGKLVIAKQFKESFIGEAVEIELNGQINDTADTRYKIDINHNKIPDSETEFHRTAVQVGAGVKVVF